ncbi:protein LDOC1-like [Ambystoma mexicanum]|uniref:protein LDOC1-like n=1 Tax=Ambystoma mexicanum TaxID=8296 RepID=UPI0037E80452
MATPEQLQELIQAVQGMNVELQNVKAENAALRQMITARESRETDLPPMSLSSGKYDGSPKRLKEFLESCAIYFAFRPHTFASAHTKVGFVISNLTGNALAWASPLVTSNNPVLQDYGAFVTLFKQTFEQAEITHIAAEELLDVQQGSSDLRTYISSFKRLAWVVQV